MESYKDKSREELLLICKNKFANGRTYDELTYFLNRHEIGKETQKYIFDELEKYEVELKNKLPEKKLLPFTPMNIVVGVVLIALGMIVLLIGGMRMGNNFIMAVLCAGCGIVFIAIEAVKIAINSLKRNGK